MPPSPKGGLGGSSSEAGGHLGGLGGWWGPSKGETSPRGYEGPDYVGVRSFQAIDDPELTRGRAVVDAQLGACVVHGPSLKVGPIDPGSVGENVLQ